LLDTWSHGKKSESEWRAERQSRVQELSRQFTLEERDIMLAMGKPVRTAFTRMRKIHDGDMANAIEVGYAQDADMVCFPYPEYFKVLDNLSKRGYVESGISQFKLTAKGHDAVDQMLRLDFALLG
jgi:hypothetical protein